MSIFRHRLPARLANSCNSGVRFLQMALLNIELLLLFDELLHHLEITEFRAQLLLNERLADLYTRLDNWNDRLKLVDRCRGRGMLGFLLRLLARECGNLGAVLGDL